MIASVTGKVSSHTKNSIIVETVSGLGYEIHLTPGDRLTSTVGSSKHFFTYLKISDQAQDLYGFLTIEAREFFTLLLTVSGVGPKTALNILSLGSLDTIQAALARGDVKYLTAVQGMGKKTAERLVVELKSKMQNVNVRADETSVIPSLLGEVIDGLVAMGYSQQEAREVVQSLDGEEKNSAVLLREALQRLG